MVSWNAAPILSHLVVEALLFELDGYCPSGHTLDRLLSRGYNPTHRVPWVNFLGRFEEERGRHRTVLGWAFDVPDYIVIDAGGRYPLKSLLAALAHLSGAEIPRRRLKRFHRKLGPQHSDTRLLWVAVSAVLTGSDVAWASAGLLAAASPADLDLVVVARDAGLTCDQLIAARAASGSSMTAWELSMHLSGVPFEYIREGARA